MEVQDLIKRLSHFPEDTEVKIRKDTIDGCYESSDISIKPNMSDDDHDEGEFIILS